MHIVKKFLGTKKGKGLIIAILTAILTYVGLSEDFGKTVSTVIVKEVAEEVVENSVEE